MKLPKYAFCVGLFLSVAPSLPAQLDSVVKGILDHVADQSRRPQPTPPPQRRTTTPRQSAPREATSRPARHPFDGTWLATQSRTNPQAQQTVSRTFTMIIKEGKATRTLDTTNASAPEKPFYGSACELQRRWTSNSIDTAEQGTSLTVQWSPGQLADWAPKTIPNPVVEGFGSPIAETSVYRLKGDELTRINDPNGLVYHRAK